MKFHEQDTIYQEQKRLGKHGGLESFDFYKKYIHEYNAGQWGSSDEQDIESRWDLATALMMVNEGVWYIQMRPYFKVWPSIIAAICKVPLCVTVKSLFAGASMKSLAIRFPCGREPAVGGCLIQSVLMSYISDSIHRQPSLVIDATCVECGPSGRRMLLHPMVLEACDSSETIEDQMRHRCDGADYTVDTGSRGQVVVSRQSIEIAKAVTRMVVSVLMLESDPEFVKPDVLAADREAFDRTGDPKYIERAKKKGIVGWRIGEEYETCPHFRRPHFGLRHTGKGKTIPKIVPIKGAVVHRNKLTQVPTGYITPEGIEVEIPCEV